MDRWLSIAAIISGIFFGIGIYKWLIVRHKDITLDNVMKVTRLPLYILGILTFILLFFGILRLNNDVMWHMPLWIDVYADIVLWGSIFISLTFLMTLSICLSWYQHHPERIKFTLAGIVLLTALLVLRFRAEPPLLIDPEGILSSDGYVLQSTYATCAPAAGANVARELGIEVGEKELAEYMRTNIQGTSPGKKIMGMRKIGLEGKRIIYKNVHDIQTPAILFVDHEDIGPETHAIAILHTDERYAEIVDPLIGKSRLMHEHLSEIWHGKAIIFDKHN